LNLVYLYDISLKVIIGDAMNPARREGFLLKSKDRILLPYLIYKQKRRDFMRSKISILLLVSFVLVFSVALISAEKADIDLKKVADKIVKAYTSVDPVAMANLYAEDAVIIEAGEVIQGRKAIQEHMESMFRAFPDFEIEILTVIPSGNHIAFELALRGTNTGPLTTPEGEIPPTGKKVEFKVIWIGRISPDGLIEEDRTYYDTVDFMRQLGLLKQ
jgi:uncharacterized protein (TIGR02246 family)